ncbi:hypothetical protein ACHAQA_008425 [Verticillium albo-atrum]
MSPPSLFVSGLLASPLFAAFVHSSPVAAAARQLTTDTPSFANIEPIVVEHGVLDDAGIKDLLSSLSADGPSATEAPQLNVRQDAPLALTTGVSDALVTIDVGDPLVACNPEEVTTVTMAGPIQTVHFWTGSSNMRSVKATSINGETTDIQSVREQGDDAGEFVFRFDERITEFFVFPTDRQFTGFNFTTTAGRTYSAMTMIGAESVAGVKVPVGSGVLGRIRGVSCPSGVFGSMGFDFLDEIQSVAVVNIDYSGFTDNVLPSGPGQTVTIGSQTIDNRNSTVEQSTNLQTTAAINKQHSLTTNFGWNIGATVTISGSAGIPFLTSGSVSASTTWGISGGIAEQDLESETVTNSGTINLKCPAGKFCVGTSFFTMFKIDVDIVATFEAKSKSGEKFTWTQKGRYEGADSLALQLRIDEVDAPPS